MNDFETFSYSAEHCLISNSISHSLLYSGLKIKILQFYYFLDLYLTRYYNQLYFWNFNPFRWMKILDFIDFYKFNQNSFYDMERYYLLIYFFFYFEFKLLTGWRSIDYFSMETIFAQIVYLNMSLKKAQLYYRH